jgi:hypothetical protein
MNKPFRVWIRPLGDACRVRVDGTENAMWLLGRLGQSVVFKNCEPIEDEEGSACSTFEVPYTPQMSRSTFEEMLADIPQLELMLEPE